MCFVYRTLVGQTSDGLCSVNNLVGSSKQCQDSSMHLLQQHPTSLRSGIQELLALLTTLAPLPTLTLLIQRRTLIRISQPLLTSPPLLLMSQLQLPLQSREGLLGCSPLYSKPLQGCDSHGCKETSLLR